MRNIIKTLTVVIILCLTLAVFTACNDDVDLTPIKPNELGGGGGDLGSLTPNKVTQPEPPVQGGEEEEDWVPDILDLDGPYIPTVFDDSVQYDYSKGAFNFTSVAGGFSVTDGNGEHPDYTVMTPNSLAVSTSTPFPYGTFSCDVKTVAGYDTGIVFGLSSDESYFWESGASYYIFLLSADGNVYLGKIDNGVWSVVQWTTYSFNTNDFYNLKVVFKNGKINCYINGTLLIEVKEKYPLTGTGFGIRGGGTGAIFKNITVTNQYIYE